MIITAHSVPSLDSGLSPMQERLLRSEKRVRLVSAPTGSGKSYAFMRAVLEENAHVLFIVPTKRLLQNLFEDAREQARQLLRERGLDESQTAGWINERITCWSGEQADDDKERLRTKRARQLQSAGQSSAGRVLFAIPEVVVKMISGVSVTGASTINPFLYVRQFDHIVFDEFHTIDDRSFGLACLFSLLTVNEGQAKLSLLSATPIDVTAILGKMGVDTDKIEQISEDVTDGHPKGHRPMHGNVTVSLRTGSLVDSIATNLDAVRESAQEDRTVIVIYDSLRRLQQDEEALRALLQQHAGIDDGSILSINSIDDSKRLPGESRRGRSYQDPRDYRVLLCTSSVEVGVTFQSTLMFMEPGHSLASFVQRVGRVSRGADDGRVIVSSSQQNRDRRPWVRKVARVIETHDEIGIGEFTERILADVRKRMEPTIEQANADLTEDQRSLSYYRKASWRGCFWAALFLVSVRRTRMRVQQGAQARLRSLSPGTVRFIETKVSEILSVDRVNDNLPMQRQPHKKWIDALFSAALTYRDIGPSVDVVDPDGTRHTVSESFLHRSSDILSRHIASEEGYGSVVHLLSRSLKEEIKAFTGSRGLQWMQLCVRSPLGSGAFDLRIPEWEMGTEKLNRRLVEEWNHRFGSWASSSNGATSSQQKVMAAATSLVERLGWAPLEADFEVAAESALFA